MNILPKKSWHVRNKDNVAKVRQDEQKAANQEKQRLQQIALAEQEARTELLRSKARELQGNQFNSSTSVALNIPQRPTNFFQALGPDGQPYSTTATNTDHEKEKQQEKEKTEKKLGVLTYLGQSAVETLAEDDKPWYFKHPSRSKTSPEGELTKSQIADKKRKAVLDPLNDMNNHLKKKKKKHGHKHHKSSKSHSKHGHNCSGIDKLAKLRKERTEREAKEKLRSLQLLQKHYGSTDSDAATGSTSFAPKFSNQFNPHLARNNKYT